jgi:hypothetical protein
MHSICLVLNNEFKNYLSIKVNNILSKDKHFTDKDILTESFKISKIFNDNFEEINNIGLVKKKLSYLYVKNLPIIKDIKGNIETQFTKIINLSLSNLLGSPYITKGHRNEKIIFDIIPIKKDKHKELGTGTKLGWHTEDAHLRKSCKFISLLCLRGDENAQTKISDICFSEVPSEIFECMTKQNFTITSDQSFKKKQS